ncbi:MAG: PD-(D/E)XK nuclease family protein, partial [Gemmatimonadetes bacterium]|nr:PD-(D/E)XK nuclease family protein [Gemmatimonadota bacterium]
SQRPAIFVFHPRRDFDLDGMPLTLVTASTSAHLWSALSERALEDGVHLWLSHRNHRDLLFEAARARGRAGWLDPPLTFLSDLPDRFDVSTRPAGLLTRRRLLARCAAEHGRRLEVGASGRHHSLARGHMLDPLLGELLSGGVEPDELRRALGAVADDDFARRRNAWVVSVHAEYLQVLGERGLHDPRQVPALLARAVAEGRLSAALAGARELHVWGIFSLGTWGALVRALAAQDGVAVKLYLPEEDEPDPEWDGLGAGRERVGEGSSALPPPRVQPAPDARRELLWVASQVKGLLTAGACEPWEVAVVARTGEDDVRRAWRALREAGVPATARIRTPLHEAAALKSLLELLGGAAARWPYRTLRDVLGSPYFDTRIDLRFLDGIAGRRRVVGLEAWAAELDREQRRLALEADARDSEGLRALAQRAAGAVERFGVFREAVEPLSAPRPEAEWIDRTLRLTAGDGLFHFRRRLSRPVDDRWDAVRLDQRSVLQLEALLREWRTLDLDDRPLTAEEWHTLLRRLLEGHQLALTTPLQKGVQVLEAHDAALTPFRHVFVVHANDGVFPRPAAAGGVLTEAERARLAGRALPLSDRVRALRRERTLWRAVTAAPSVTITYRSTDPAGTPLLPSLMVPDHDVDTELPRTWEPEDPIDEEQLHRALADRLADADDLSPIAAPAPALLRRAVVAAHAEDGRAALERVGIATEMALTPWAGWIRDPASRALLEERYGEEHVWSASQLEAYAACPWLFFVERVLRLEDVAEVEEETDALTFGGVAHRLLERFWKRMKDRAPGEWDLRVEAEYAEVQDEVMAALEEEGQWTGLPVLWRETRRDVSDAVREYLRWELPGLAKRGDRPELVEHGFGRDAGDPVRIRGRDRRARAASILLAGRVDRVDRGTGGALRILDYKSSTVPAAKSYKDGVTLQSALYMTALHEQTGEPVERAGYRSIKKPGTGSRSDIRWGDAAFETALALALSIPERVRSGRFEPVQAASAGWKGWHPGRDVCRTRGELVEGTRWDDEDGEHAP